MAGSRASLWGLWAFCVVLLALELGFADFVAARRTFPWHSAQTAVWGFALGVVAMALGVWTFALRESLALRDVRSGALDPATPVGFIRIRQMLAALWILCLAIGLLGSVVAWGSGDARAAWPYLLGAAALLALHAPRSWISGRPPAPAS